MPIATDIVKPCRPGIIAIR